ncbi:MAG: outer membrane lipoprotein LolB [Neisseria sp.]|nr:outer membrane lipoprotein LolB [Neisseria sp.]
MRKIFLPALMSGWLLAACAAPDMPQTASWQPEREIADFAAEGRLAVNVDGKGYYANFDWAWQNGVQTIDINTPLGNTLGSLCQDKIGVLAANSNGEVFYADSPQTLSRKLLGFALPLEHLNAWANGYWTASLPHQVNADGSLQQADWRIERSVGADGQWKSLTAENPKLSMKLVFSDVQSGRQEDAPEQCEARTAK